MEADLHAVVMISVPIATLAVLWRLKEPAMDTTRRSSWREISLRLIYGVTTFFVFFAVVMVGVRFYNGGFAPSNQIWLPIISAMIVAVFANRQRVRFYLIAILIVCAVILGNHYNRLVYSKTACRYTGQDIAFISNSCNQPAKSGKLWHSPLTGIYEVQLLQSEPIQVIPR